MVTADYGCLGLGGRHPLLCEIAGGWVNKEHGVVPPILLPKKAEVVSS